MTVKPYVALYFLEARKKTRTDVPEVQHGHVFVGSRGAQAP